MSALPAQAAPEWRVVLAPTSSTITLPNLPAPGTYSVGLPGPVISDSAAANLNFVVRLSATNYDLWQERAGVLSPYAQVGAVGSTGPGRVGAEAGHVFRRMVNQSTTFVMTDTNLDDARVFSALAGDANVALDATSFGAWIAGSAGNIEIARLGVEGALGPNIGAGWRLSGDGSSGFGQLHALPNGAVLIQTNAQFTGTALLPYDALVRHQPGAGNTTCSVTQQTNSAWAPGVLGNDYFTGIRYASSSPQGEVYAAANIARQTPLTVRNGIWQFCAGVPQVKVLSDNTGPLGPNIPGNATAVFNRVAPNIGPGTAGSFYFTGENAVSSNTFKGVFHHSGGQNRPLLLNGVEGVLGTQIPGFVFSTNLDYDPISAGQFAVIGTFIRPVAGTATTFGLWRLRPNASPEPIAIVDDTGSFAPASGRRWRDLGPFNILANGDVMFFAATTNPPSLLNTVSLWRIRPGRIPEEILKPGDQVRAPTAAGTASPTVTSINRPGAGDLALREYGGDDSWLSASGKALVSVEINPIGGVSNDTRAWIRGQVSDLDVLLQDGFE